jgi:hypothetical protein
MIAFPAHLALTLPDNPTLAESLQYQLTGFLVVAFTLGALAFLVSLIGRLFAALDARRATVSAALPAPVPARTPEPSPSAEEISPAVLAAIAGAVAATLGDSRFAIRGVQVADPRQNLAWSAEGRRSIYASRNVR